MKRTFLLKLGEVDLIAMTMILPVLMSIIKTTNLKPQVHFLLEILLMPNLVLGFKKPKLSRFRWFASTETEQLR
ncbi:MAG: hypothetical protein R2769_07810 [Saprospiraceae bacterium]